MREKKWIALCVVALVVLAMMNLPDATSVRVKGAVRDGVSPLQAVLSGGMHEAREILRYVRGVGDLAAENRALTEQLAVLRGEVERMREFETDNRKLRDLMGFTEKSAQRLVSCEVTGRDSTGWWQTVRLDKGRRGGVAGGRAVITADGLAGRTTGVSERTADVLLVSDPSCKVSVRLERTAVFGVLSGTGDAKDVPARCRMDYIPLQEPVEEGAEVVTSGLGGVFPRGLRVGTVVGVEVEEGGLYQRAWVEPLADLPQLEYAFVIATEEDLRAAEGGGAALELEDWGEGSDGGDAGEGETGGTGEGEGGGGMDLGWRGTEGDGERAALRAVRAAREGLFALATGQKVALRAAAVFVAGHIEPPVGRMAANRGQPTGNPYGVGRGGMDLGNLGDLRDLGGGGTLGTEGTEGWADATSCGPPGRRVA